MRAKSRQIVRMTATQPRVGGIEIRSIDYAPLSERHGKVWHLGPLLFMSNGESARVLAFSVTGTMALACRSWS